MSSTRGGDFVLGLETGRKVLVVGVGSLFFGVRNVVVGGGF